MRCLVSRHILCEPAPIWLTCRTSFLIQRLLECERVTHQEAVKENIGMRALLAEHGIEWPAGKFVDKAAMEE